MRSSDDFFHSLVDRMIDLRHPLAVLSSHMLWQEIEASLVKQVACEVKKGQALKRSDLLDHRLRSWVVVYLMPAHHGYPSA